VPFLQIRYLSREDAALAAQLLGDEGIEAWVSAADAGGVLPSMQSVVGVRIEVSDEHLERANSIVQEMFPEPTATGRRLSTREKIQGWAIGALLVLTIGWVIYSHARALLDGESGEATPTPPQHELPF